LYDVIILGAGPAGLAAGIQLALFRLNTLILEVSDKVGGIAIRARGIRNYPGFMNTSGARLMERMRSQAEKAGVEIRTSEEVIKLSLQEKEKVVETFNASYSCRALILATGIGMKGLNIKGESWIGGGVAYCAECIPQSFQGNDIVIVGSVAEAVQESLYLAKIAKRVRLVNHKNLISINEETKRRLKREGVQLIEDFVVEEIRGKPPIKLLLSRHVDNLKVKKLKTNIAFIIGGVKPFVFILKKAGIKTHRLGCILVDGFGNTNIEGVFAAGGCTSTVKDTIPVCVGDGAHVATCVRLYLKYTKDYR